MGKISYEWQVKAVDEECSVLIPWLQNNKMPDFLAPLLWQRGIHTEADLAHFFKPSPELIHDPYLMYDMEKAVERIQEAIALGQKILIYGDYDADGITSATVMKEAIETVGGEALVYLPNRFKDGYGPNKERYKQLITEQGIELIITVDNGVAGHEAIDYANSVGVDVVVTDHHEIPEQLPAAFAIVHPRHPSGDYPFGELAGVGVAFKVATALLEEAPEEMLDLVAIGTIADLVPLVSENRVLVQYGLEVMKQGQRTGLNALLKAADIKLPEITEESIGFGIGPRLNAIGRLGDATPGVDLLSCYDENEAAVIAGQVNEINSQRQEIVKAISKEALEMVQTIGPKDIYVLAKEGWHEGVLGIVASKVVQETGKPALVLGINEETKVAKGSGRSVPQVNLYEALKSAGELFIAFGGHQMAAGMSLTKDNLPAIQEKLNDYLRDAEIDLSKGPVLEIDGELSINDIGLKQIEGLRLLAPFGTDNPSPTFIINDISPTDVKQIGADKTHLKFQVAEETNSLDCLAFNFGGEWTELKGAEKVSVAGQLSINEWNGNKKPQMMIKDFKIPGLQVLDKRGQAMNVEAYDWETTLFVYNDAKLLAKDAKEGMNSQLIHEEIPPGTWGEIVFVDCPTESMVVKEYLSQLNPKKIHLYFTSKEEAYLNGMPSREQFAQLFKFIATYDQVDVRHKLPEMSQFLKIKTSLLIFMIQVFSDLGFVTIEDGLMTQVISPQNQPLSESVVYQTREQKMITEKFLLYSKLSELKSWLLS